jgi:ribosomal protein S18 acetylase RimI-like enzyme
MVELLEPQFVDLEEIVAFLTACDSDFLPPLSRQTDLYIYAAKLLAHARLAGVREGRELKGLVGFYCNDLATGRAYLSCLAVKREARHVGLGSELIQQAIIVSKAAGMKTLELETNREVSVTFYRRAGFEVFETSPGSGYTNFRMRRPL